MKVRKTVHLRNSLDKLVTLHPGDEIPAWAKDLVTNTEITGEKAVEVEPVKDSADEPEPESVDYSKLKKGELQELCLARGLSGDGKVDELKARLAADDLADVDADVWAMSEDELREFAAAKGIDVGEASSSVELATVIEQAIQ